MATLLPHVSPDREELLRLHMPLARGLARRYAGKRHDCEDLEQVAYMGLLKAIDRFEPDRGVKLTTYATPVIAGEIKRHLRDTAWAVKVPRGAKELSVRIEATLPRLTAVLGRSPTIAEIARQVGADAEDVLEALEARAAASVASLDQAAEGDSERGPGREPAAEDAGFGDVENRAVLEPALRHLTVRERRVLELRFAEGLTQAEIGTQIGVSQMHVSRILRGALERAAQGAAAA